MTAVSLCRFRDTEVKLESITQSKEEWGSYDLCAGPIMSNYLQSFDYSLHIVCPRDFSGKNTEVGCFLLRGSEPTSPSSCTAVDSLPVEPWEARPMTYLYLKCPGRINVGKCFKVLREVKRITPLHGTGKVETILGLAQGPRYCPENSWAGE